MTEDRLPWFPCYPSKLLGAFSAMKPTEGYVYWIVCLRIYEVGGPCPDSLDAMARRTGYNRRVVSDALDRLFRLGKLVRTTDGITNPFAEQVIAARVSLRKERESAGRVGGLRSAEKRQRNQTTHPSKTGSKPEQSSTHLHLHSTRFPNGNLAQGAEANNGELFPLAVASAARIAQPSPDPEVELFRRGKEVLGPTAGGLIKRLFESRGRNVAKSRAVIEEASTKESPREYVGGALRDRKAFARNGPAASLRRRMEERDHDQESAGGVVDAVASGEPGGAEVDRSRRHP